MKTYGGESVRWHVTMGSTPITAETPGASDPYEGASILPGVFEKDLVVDPAAVQFRRNNDLTAGNRPGAFFAVGPKKTTGGKYAPQGESIRYRGNDVCRQPDNGHFKEVV
jgi:hypothetical protein